ncbi:hypothetical protein GGD63_002901 [Bradyrhizobium sp. cir1]|uniref:hypothetical protein n=1 Tax=Bradyrhizobium sp. cir1 TaxID=1445730 RepID=UPI001606ED73|nr:hypothetical protein [Bradyrhizobium sp. cir1]MBB4370108.1 hypothetical protein [Bradyrhizobium sp. cir1]
MTTSNAPMIITKLDAARRQLATAIRLWFRSGDAVSIHTLAFAAYEVIHFISIHRDKYRRDLLFDSDLIKDEHRAEFNKLIRSPANFFKHADRDPDGAIEYDPVASEAFILFAILGLATIKEPSSDEEAAFMFWRYFHHPDQLTEAGRKTYVDGIPENRLAEIRSIPKDQFFEAFTTSRWMNRRLEDDRAKHTIRLPPRQKPTEAG